MAGIRDGQPPRGSPAQRRRKEPRRSANALGHGAQGPA